GGEGDPGERDFGGTAANSGRGRNLRFQIHAASCCRARAAQTKYLRRGGRQNRALSLQRLGQRGYPRSSSRPCWIPYYGNVGAHRAPFRVSGLASRVSSPKLKTLDARRGTTMAIKEITPQQAHDILTKDPSVVYIDVRTEREFANGHPIGAVNIPVAFPDP